MLHRFVERNRLIVVGSANRNVPCVRQGSGHEPMPNRERACRLLLCGQRQELRRKIAHGVAVERNKVRGPDAVQN